MLKIRRSQDRLIFNMGIPILIKQYLYAEMVPRTLPGLLNFLHQPNDLLEKDIGKLDMPLFKISKQYHFCHSC